jgi:hypothetical protein
MAKLINSKNDKLKRNPARVDALIKSAQYSELASQVSDREMATAYRMKSAHFRELADELPEWESEVKPAVERLLEKAAAMDELATTVFDHELSVGYQALAKQHRDFAKDIEDGRVR